MKYDLATDLPESYSRREFLGALGTASVLSLGGSVSGSPNLPYYTGVSSQDTNPEFKEHLDSIYSEEFTGFDAERPNVVFDVIQIGDHSLERGIADTVEMIHDDRGINAFVGRREESFPKEEFLEYYGGDAAKILGVKDSYQGFIDGYVSPEMKEAAVQVIMTPGIQEEPWGALENSSEEDLEERYNLGYANDTKAAIASNEGFSHVYGKNYLAGKARLVMHEIGHTYGLDHSDKISEVMHPEVSLDADFTFIPGEWRAIKRRLDSK